MQAWFANNDTEIEPGTSHLLELTLTNLGNATDSFALTPSGLAAGWSTVRPAYVTLFGGAQETVHVQVSPPRLPSTTAGPTTLGIRVVPQSSPDDVENAEITLHVASTFDRRISALQPALRARRRTVYELLVENQGNAQASCRMHLIDPTQRVDGDFDPPAVGIEPGGTALVRLKLRATRRQWERRSNTIPFRVEADQQGAPGVEVTATFVQAPVLPERAWWRLAGIAALAGLAAVAWLGVVRPAIDDAAEQAVANLDLDLDLTVTPATTPGAALTESTDGATPAGTPAGTPAAPTEQGEPKTVPIPGSAGLGETSSVVGFTVPAGQVFLVTDYLVQNPGGDSGTARLVFGDPTTALEWDMAVNLDGVDASGRLNTPIQLLAGQQVVFEVECRSPGRVGSAACSARALVTGRLVPA